MTGAGRHHKPEQRQAAVLLPAPEMALEAKEHFMKEDASIYGSLDMKGLIA